MTGAEMRAVRDGLGLSAERFARLLRVAGGRTVRQWEAEDRAISGPVAIVVELLRDHPREMLRWLDLDISPAK